MKAVAFKAYSRIRKLADDVFNKERKKIQKLLPEAYVEHVGSTAIPGSITKGDLDINIRVPQDRFEEYLEKLKGLYVLDLNNPKTNTIASFILEDHAIPVGIQLTVIGSEDDIFIKHRDILKDNKMLLERYNTLKEQFEGKEMQEYRKKKADFFSKPNTKR